MKAIHLAPQRNSKKPISATRIIIIIIFGIIVLGTVLLMLPVSSRSHTFTDPETAAFTAISASCITGLVLCDTMLHWSTFGQIVIITMIQIGGLGFMTLALLFSILIKRTITPKERLIAAQSLGLEKNGGALAMVQFVITGTFAIEGIGAICLSTQFVPIFGWHEGIYQSVFTSISAFCNAGFDLMGAYSGASSSLCAFRDNPVVNFTIMLLILSGGIGFLIWYDFAELLTHRRRFRAYTKFILIISAVLVFGGALMILALEYNNPQSLGPLPFEKKLLCALFHSVSTRTAGMSTIDNVYFTDATKLVSSILMLVGGASGSTAGGLKMGTVGLVIYAMIKTAAGHGEITLFRRRISTDNILRAMSIVGIGLTLILLSTLSISLIDGVPLIDALYECASALATVGLTAGLTASLSTPSHLILMALMFCGKIGILSATYAITLRSTSAKAAFTYPDENIPVG